MRKKTIEEELREVESERQEEILATSFEKKRKEQKPKTQKEIDEMLSKKSLAELDEEYSSGKFEKKYNIPKKTPAKQKQRSTKGAPTFVLIFAALVFFCSGLGVSIFAGIAPWIKSGSYIETKAEVIDVNYYHNSDGDLMGTPIYEYYVDGQRYVQKSPISSSYNICHQIGDIVTIRYNPKNPNEIMAEDWLHIVLTFFGVPFVAVGVFLFVVAIKERQKRKKK